MLASLGRLERIDTGCDANGEVLDELGFIGRMSEFVAEDWVREIAGRLFGDTGIAGIEEIERKRGWRNVALFLLTRINAAAARFSSVDDRLEERS